MTAGLEGTLTAKGRAAIAVCMQCLLADGTTVYGFTTLDRDLTIDLGDGHGSVVYESASGATSSEVSNNGNNDVDSMEITLLLNSARITEADVLAGKWNGAQVKLFLVNWEDLSQGVLKMRTGWLGQVVLDRGTAKAELLGLLQHFQSTIGEVVSQTCLNDFCGAVDGRGRGCGLDIATFTETGVVTDWDPDLMILYSNDFAGFADGTFDEGRVTFDAQPWITFGIKISRQVEGALVLKQFPPFTVTAGMAITVTKGCLKTFDFCRDSRSNAARFRGFPHLKGNDKLVQFGRRNGS